MKPTGKFWVNVEAVNVDMAFCLKGLFSECKVQGSELVYRILKKNNFYPNLFLIKLNRQQRCRMLDELYQFTFGRFTIIS